MLVSNAFSFHQALAHKRPRSGVCPTTTTAARRETKSNHKHRWLARCDDAITPEVLCAARFWGGISKWYNLYRGSSFNLVSRSCSPSREFTLGLTDECIGRAYLKLKNRSVIKAFFSAFSHIHKPILKGQRHTLIACVTRRFVSSSCSVCSTYYFGFPNEQQESSSWVPFSLFRPALKHWLSQISHLGTTFANCAIIASSPLCIAHSLHQLNTVWYRHQLPAPASEEV